MASERRPLALEDFWSLKTVSDARLSPDGETVAYVVGTYDETKDEGRSAVWLANVAGGEARQFTSGEATDAQPHWSPDGTRLAFVSARHEGKPQIFIIPATAASPAGSRRTKTAPLRPCGRPTARACATPWPWRPTGRRWRGRRRGSKRTKGSTRRGRACAARPAWSRASMAAATSTGASTFSSSPSTRRTMGRPSRANSPTVTGTTSTLPGPPMAASSSSCRTVPSTPNTTWPPTSGRSRRRAASPPG